MRGAAADGMHTYRIFLSLFFFCIWVSEDVGSVAQRRPHSTRKKSPTVVPQEEVEEEEERGGKKVIELSLFCVSLSDQHLHSCLSRKKCYFRTHRQFSLEVCDSVSTFFFFFARTGTQAMCASAHPVDVFSSAWLLLIHDNIAPRSDEARTHTKMDFPLLCHHTVVFPPHISEHWMTEQFKKRARRCSRLTVPQCLKVPYCSHF